MASNLGVHWLLWLDAPRSSCRGSAPTSTPEVAAFADRDLTATTFPYAFLDATYWPGALEHDAGPNQG
jgi:hypothetical protein